MVNWWYSTISSPKRALILTFAHGQHAFGEDLESNREDQAHKWSKTIHVYTL